MVTKPFPPVSWIALSKRQGSFWNIGEWAVDIALDIAERTYIRSTHFPPCQWVLNILRVSFHFIVISRRMEVYRRQNGYNRSQSN